MHLVFPQEEPKRREEVLDFIKANLPALKERCASAVEARMKDVTMEEIDDKWKGAVNEYGPSFRLFDIHAVQEAQEELTDLVSYFAMEMLQAYFNRNE